MQRINPEQKILSKELRDEVQGPCQISSFMTSLLHPHLLRCRLQVGVLRQMRLMIKFRIGIKAKSFYELMKKCHGILCFWHKHFLFGCLHASMKLKIVRVSMSRSTTKMTKILRIVLLLSYRMNRLPRFSVTQIYPNFLPFGLSHQVWAQTQREQI